MIDSKNELAPGGALNFGSCKAADCKLAESVLQQLFSAACAQMSLTGDLAFSKRIFAIFLLQQKSA